jgi:hypothetical protein
MPRKVNMSRAEENELWANHKQTYKNDLSMVGVKTEQILGVKNTGKNKLND